MDELSRRKMLIVSGGALGAGALGALGAASPAQAQSRPAWTWNGKTSSVARLAAEDPRWVWDVEADPLLASVLDRGDVPVVNEVLRTWTRNDQPLPAGLPDDVHAFVEQARQLPSWADQTKLDQAAQFVDERGQYLILAYGLGSGLMSCAIPREARAVYYSKGGADMRDRSAKTAKFGYDVHQPNAYDPEGEAVVSAVKTRLVHAAVRHLLPQSPDWPGTGSGAIPISQNEILVTWHSLATYVMRKFAEWGVPATDAEDDAFLHLWQVNAHMLGVRDEYIPATWEAANEQSRQILDPALGPTPEGVNLAEQILDIASLELDAPRSVLHALGRYLVGDQIANWIEIPREPIWDPMIRTGFPLFVALREGLIWLPLVPEIVETIDRALASYVLFYLSEGQRVNIDIPETNRPS